MSHIIHWIYRFGLFCGLLLVLSGLVPTLSGLGVVMPAALMKVALAIFRVTASGFMASGVVLLGESLIWLVRLWPNLSSQLKVVCILGLGTSTFAGAYVFHWVLPNLRQYATSSQARHA